MTRRSVTAISVIQALNHASARKNTPTATRMMRSVFMRKPSRQDAGVTSQTRSAASSHAAPCR